MGRRGGMGRSLGGGSRSGGGMGRSLGGGARSSGGMGRSLGGGARSGSGMGRSLGGGGSGQGRSPGGGFGGIGAPRPSPPRQRGGLSGGAGFGLGLGTGLLLGGRRRRGFFGFGGRRGMGMGPGMGMGGPGMGRGGCGCGSIIMVLVVLVLLLSVISLIGNWNPIGVEQPPHIFGAPVSTRVREPLAAMYVNDTGPMFEDNLGWIDNVATLEAGLRAFFAQTGVRPFVYITGNINADPFFVLEDLENFAIALYDERIMDFGHALVVVYEHGERPREELFVHVQPGTQARLIMDDEAIDILIFHLADFSRRFHSPGVGITAQAFAYAFESTADVIMYRPPDNRAIWITLIIVAGVVIVGLIFVSFWKKRQVQKNLEAEQTERILSQDLSTFSEDDATMLARQYEDET